MEVLDTGLNLRAFDVEPQTISILSQRRNTNSTLLQSLAQVEANVPAIPTVTLLNALTVPFFTCYALVKHLCKLRISLIGYCMIAI